MNNREIKSSLKLTALALAVVLTLPVIAGLAIAFRAAGVLLIVTGLALTGIALTVSPSFRNRFRAVVGREECRSQEQLTAQTGGAR